MSEQSWYSIKNAAADAPATVYIYSEIGEWGITADSFAREFNQIESDTVDVRINSAGGSVFAGFAIHTILANSGKAITVYIDSLAASIASIIALAGDKIHIADKAYFMMHNPAGIVLGGSKAMQKTAKLLDQLTGTLADIYSQKSGKSRDEIMQLMEDETWLTGQQAVDAGFADDVFQTAKIAASYDLSAFGNVPSNQFSAPDAGPTKTKTEMETPENKQPAPKTFSEAEVEAIKAEVIAKIVEADAKAKADEKQRITDITALGKAHGLADEANEAIAESTNVEAFKDAVIENLSAFNADLQKLNEKLQKESGKPTPRAALTGAPDGDNKSTEQEEYDAACEARDPVRKGKALKALYASQKA
jgi:ATP-dependent protease ClpP protease subunit